MAEQSIGMATGSGDGVVGGYTTARMTAKEAKSFGSGIMLVGGFCIVTGTGTSSLNVASGAIYNNGYFYENTSTLTFSISAVAAGTYYLVNRVNDTGSTATVLASASGTTIPARSVRCCVVTIASYTASTDVIVATVTISGGSVTAISSIWNSFAQATHLKAQQSATLTKSTGQTISVANTPTTITWAAGASSTADIISYDSANNRFKINLSGTYYICVSVTLTGTTTGTRGLWIASSGGEFNNVFPHTQTNIASAGYSKFTGTMAANIYANSFVTVQYETSATGCIVSDATFNITRL